MQKYIFALESVIEGDCYKFGNSLPQLFLVRLSAGMTATDEQKQ
ncbi:hypothetical protein [Clostridium yunnanense]|nr:hypothetical protein [Clostridium yunnanense]